MNIREKMNAGMLYTDMGEESLAAERTRCQNLLYDYNLTRPTETERRRGILTELLGDCGEDIWIEPPFKMAYGKRTHIGNCFYANFNLVIVDDIDVWIGDHVMIAPNVTISVTGHPVHPELRKDGSQFSFPVRIGNDVWIGAGAVILPGVTIGDGAVIGAGSVVTHDIPPNVVAFGVPCRVRREITDRDREFYWKDLRVE
ncbi:MAG TPA: galactoside O-acetyltransferase [Candidatus Merdivicinus intestinavium]|nr:galactoside O-acetyltransferase [Candidatus Merdivicinus intestinavium]